MARHEFQLEFDPSLDVSVWHSIDTFYRRQMPFENAGLSVNLVEAAVQRQGARIGRLQKRASKGVAGLNYRLNSRLLMQVAKC